MLIPDSVVPTALGTAIGTGAGRASRIVATIALKRMDAVLAHGPMARAAIMGRNANIARKLPSSRWQ
jgi:hypothetical protein